jgi:hypothetical protein
MGGPQYAVLSYTWAAHEGGPKRITGPADRKAHQADFRSRIPSECAPPPRIVVLTDAQVPCGPKDRRYKEGRLMGGPHVHHVRRSVRPTLYRIS